MLQICIIWILIVYLIALKCAMHIILAPIVRYYRKIQIFKSKRVILKQKPCEFVWQYREDCIDTQWTSIPVLDLAVIKGIKTAMLASTPHQSVHNMPSNLQIKIN